MEYFRQYLAGLVLCLQTGLAAAALNDVFPGDFVALPAGKGGLTAYLYERQQEAGWTQGRRVGDMALDSTVVALRINRFYRVGGYTVAPLIVLSGAQIDLSGNAVPPSVDRARSGSGDLRLGGALWLIDDPQNRHYLALNLMTVWPTGRYAGKQLANVGENRRRHSLTLGWVRGIGADLTLDLVPELAWYGDNDAAFPGAGRTRQKRTESFTGYLRYRFAPAWQGYLGYQINAGGATTTNGVFQDNPIHGRRHMLGGSFAIDKGSVIHFRYAADRAVSNGLKTTNEFSLRWSRMY